MFSRRRWLYWLVLVLVLAPGMAAAQTQAGAVLSPLQTTNFPEISAYLQVYDAAGSFVPALRPENIAVQEDDVFVPVTEWIEIQTGAQFVLAINTGPTLAIRDVNGIARLDYIRQAITGWIDTFNGPTSDDWSLITTDGYEHLHLNDPQLWLEKLNAYDSDLRNATPSLDVLAKAIEIAADPTPRPGMGRAVLLITPPPDRAGIAALQSLFSRAQQEQVRIYVWMVSSPDYFTADGGLQLAETAVQTRGSFFGYSGQEPFPDLQAYLDPLRSIYQLRYLSQIKTGGAHTVLVNIEAGDLTAQSNPRSFEIDLRPPNPIFITPPLQIVRANRAAIDETLSAEADYSPKTQAIEILIEFPDGQPRQLVRTTLYVNGQIAAENTAEPFDQFDWDLRPYTSSGDYFLQVEALDELGLSSLSIETRVQIVVQQTPQSVVSALARNAPLTAGLVVALTGSLLLLVLIIGGRLQPRHFGRLRRKGRAKRQQAKDPVTQPVPVKPIPSRSPGWINRLAWPQRQPEQPASAFLEGIQPRNGDQQPATRIPLQLEEITLGQDPTLASIVLNDSSIDGLHTRLRRDEHGAFWLSDENSTAGTWVNYSPVSRGGTKLEHGDIIHIGKFALRFLLSDTKEIPKPIVEPLELEP